jgi:hypothetical protein
MPTWPVDQIPDMIVFRRVMWKFFYVIKKAPISKTGASMF